MKYIFRGRVVLNYDPDTKELTTPVDPDTGIPEMNMCKFIPADYTLLCYFMDQARYDVLGLTTNLADIEVD